MKDAYKIAYSAQYVDDNTEEYFIHGINGIYKNTVTQSINIFDPNMENIHIAHHFVPGNDIKVNQKRVDGQISYYTTTPNSSVAQELLLTALEASCPYLIGIASHAYTDTWAHQNFTGRNESYNALGGVLSSLIPNIGHGDALHAPDEIDTIWYDDRLKQPKVVNKYRFIEAANSMLAIFAKYNKVAFQHNYFQFLNNFVRPEKNRLKKLLLYKQRIKHYHKLSNGCMYEYKPDEWLNEAVIKKDKKLYWKKDYYKSNWFLFQESAKIYQKYSLNTIAKNISNQITYSHNNSICKN